MAWEGLICELCKKSIDPIKQKIMFSDRMILHYDCYKGNNPELKSKGVTLCHF